MKFILGRHWKKTMFKKLPSNSENISVILCFSLWTKKNCSICNFSFFNASFFKHYDKYYKVTYFPWHLRKVMCLSKTHSSHSQGKRQYFYSHPSLTDGEGSVKWKSPYALPPKVWKVSIKYSFTAGQFNISLGFSFVAETESYVRLETIKTEPCRELGSEVI